MVKRFWCNPYECYNDKNGKFVDFRDYLRIEKALRLSIIDGIKIINHLKDDDIIPEHVIKDYIDDYKNKTKLLNKKGD